MIMTYQEKLQQQAKFVQSKLEIPEGLKTGVILGTGLGDWLARLKSSIEIPYHEIPGFPQSTVETHTGKLGLGFIDSSPIITLQGRFHIYEGYTAKEVCMGVRLLSLLGIENLILTNASGALNPYFQPGSIMVITDQINLTGTNPLIGQNIEDWGPRFPDMSQMYSLKLQKLAFKTGLAIGLYLEKGVYIGVSGPNLETPAETRVYKRLGADAIGMSTVLEAIAAKHMGLNILGLSCLTNLNLPDCMAEISFEEVVEKAMKTGKDLERLLTALIPYI